MFPQIDFAPLEDSLRYAQVIQQGLLPKHRHFQRLFTDSFVIFLPQHYVSGDFYWIGRRQHLRYLAVGDCTGHGVPGAMLSVLATHILEYAIMNKGIKKTHKILKELDKRFIESFHGGEDGQFNNDWIDISLCCIDEVEKRIYYSSANRKMLLVREKGLGEVYHGSSYPIGGWQIREDRPFRTVSMAYTPGDRIYIGSDGFQDQIGGPREKKFKSKKLHELLVQTASWDLTRQKKILEKEFSDWKSGHFQLDDVCLVGVQL